MIQAIYISKVRNGKIESPTEASVVAGKGIEGDRYFLDENRKSEDYQVTFIESEQVDQYNKEHSEYIEFWQPRRNILTKGVSLNALIGSIFQIGDAKFEGLETCEPCELLRSRTSPIAFKWFVGKGGLRARVLQSGKIRVGDQINWMREHKGG